VTTNSAPVCVRTSALQQHVGDAVVGVAAVSRQLNRLCVSADRRTDPVIRYTGE